MSIVLQPGNHFTVVRQISNHLDSATYYVQAVIRNAYTDEIIATLNLDNKGGQRFTKNWLVPQDPSGQGFYVSIVTSVYTDSGYTTKSENYGDDENTFLVQDRITVGRIGGQGGGIDAFDLRRIVKEELSVIEKKKEKKEKKEEKTEKEEKIDRTDEILNAIAEINNEIVTFALKPADYSSVESKIDSIKDVIVSAINDKEVTEKTNLDPVLEEISLIKSDIESGINKILDVTDEFTQNTPDSMKKTITESVNNALKDAQFNLNMPFKLESTPKSPEKEEKPLRDLSQLL